MCEGVIILRNIPYFEETQLFTISLPNDFNFGFHFPSLLRAYLLFGFFPVLYTMMNYMYQLRCKKLNIKQHKLNRPKKEDWIKFPMTQYNRCTSIWTKLSYQFLDWTIVRHCPKGQLGQIWVKLGQNWGRARSRKNRAILEGKWGPIMQKIERFNKNWIFEDSKAYYL